MTNVIFEVAMAEEGFQSENIEKQHNINDFIEFSAENTLQKSYLRCVDVLEADDCAEKVDFNHDALSSPPYSDIGQLLLEKLPISIPMKNPIGTCSSSSCSDLDDIDPLKRPFSPDAAGPSEQGKVSFLESNGDIILKFDDEQELENARLMERTNTSSKTISVPLKNFYLAGPWNPLESALSSFRRIQPRKPIALEVCDSSFSSTSIGEVTNELQELFEVEPFPYRHFQKIEDNGLWKPEKLPKEDKEEVEKFLNGFFTGPLEWTSDTGESSDSEISSYDEQKIANTISKGDVSFDSSEAEEAGSYPTTQSHSDTNISSGEVFLEKHRNSPYAQGTYLNSDASLLLKSEDNLNKKVCVCDDKNKQVENRNESEHRQILPINENFRLEQISARVWKPLFDLTVKADDCEQEALLSIRFGSSECSHINKDSAGETCQVNDQCREIKTLEKSFSLESKDLLREGDINNKVILLLKAEENNLSVWGSSLQVNKEIHHRLSEKNDLMLVNDNDQNVFAGTHCVLDQHLETASFARSGKGLDLEESRVFRSDKNRGRVELLQAEVGPSEKVANLTAISSDDHIVSKAFNGVQTNSLVIASNMQAKLGHQAHVQESATDFADNLSKLLNAIGEGTGNSDVALVSLSGFIPFSGPFSGSGSISISHRSDSSSNSTRSFAFPILPSDWNSSPVRMAPADYRYQPRKRHWRLCYFCCRKPATKV